jgi:hypothetical protein
MTMFTAALTFDHAIPLPTGPWYVVGWQHRVQRGIDIRVDAEAGTAELAPWCGNTHPAALRVPTDQLRQLARMLHRLADDHDMWRGEAVATSQVRLLPNDRAAVA